jgi:hypothetical protein
MRGGNQDGHISRAAELIPVLKDFADFRITQGKTLITTGPPPGRTGRILDRNYPSYYDKYYDNLGNN